MAENEDQRFHVRTSSVEDAVDRLAEGVAELSAKLDRFEASMIRQFKELRAEIPLSFVQLEQRITSLEKGSGSSGPG